MFKTNINLNLYKVFYEVCKYGSFSKAAEFTFTTQSSISKSIKKLESLLETELFFRHNNGIELTSKGRELLFYVEKSYGNLITAERLMMETDNLSRGKLSIGLPSYIASFFFFDKIIDFHNKYPNIEITLMNGSTSQLLDLLDKHKLDFIIDTTPIESNNKDLDVIKLLSVNYTFFTKSDSYDKYKSSNMEMFDLIDREKFNELVSECNYLITHGGVGSILTGLKSGKKVIACPRLCKYKEHINDHQVQIVEEFSKCGYILPYYDGDSLEEVIKKIKSFKPKKYVSNTENLVNIIKDFIDKN